MKLRKIGAGILAMTMAATIDAGAFGDACICRLRLKGS